MNYLTQDQRSKVQNLTGITNMRESAAITLLKDCRWDIQVAVNTFYGGGSGSNTTSQSNTKSLPPVNVKQIEKIFDDFKDDTNYILIEGMEKFCAALDVDPTDVVMLVMAWHLKAENMCEFTRSGFIEGWTKLRYRTQDPP
ncbi:hypothetical protein BCR41DRAFT_100524 [Lobosporangium transversale]|uniref:Defective in cullin neddylation protein n=1 Tax=Lobosporangium transversale TaxID=64571 RepID=A0A1Y2GJ46_9FUNG|nr:hypothetical protein BCR41DRAFT_100524 [Lobosporangium transversale]ORZ12480.1 hypothetical protein BCR41DRAFT_100524 [Lobosporangium transversale]|eukprot:XP_021880099.1 hypothetical protein BCR41DRAFT_100524 [Lobosporangium transversale]